MKQRVGAIITKNQAVLLVTGFDEAAHWTPGGRKEEGETDEQALRRELREELGLEVTGMTPYLAFQARSEQTGEDLAYAYYRVDCQGEPAPADEVTGYVWATRADIEAGSPLTYAGFREYVAPRLVADTLI